MAPLIFALLVVMQPASANQQNNIHQVKPRRVGWFKAFCERHLIAEDPYQDLEPLWELKKTDPAGHIDRVLKAYLKLGARAYWHRDMERTRLKALGSELRFLNHEHPEERIEDVLTRYQHLE